MGMFYGFMWCKMKILHGFRWDIIIFLVCDEAFCRYFMVCDEAQYIYIYFVIYMYKMHDIDILLFDLGWGTTRVFYDCRVWLWL